MVRQVDKAHFLERMDDIFRGLTLSQRGTSVRKFAKVDERYRKQRTLPQSSAPVKCKMNALERPHLVYSDMAGG